MPYKELRDGNGKVVGKYDPQREILQIKSRGTMATFDLRSMRGVDEPPAGGAGKQEQGTKPKE
jgi:hypothetical protein